MPVRDCARGTCLPHPTPPGRLQNSARDKSIGNRRGGPLLAFLTSLRVMGRQTPLSSSPWPWGLGERGRLVLAPIWDLTRELPCHAGARPCPALWAPESWPPPCPAAGNTSPLCTEMTRGRIASIPATPGHRFPQHHLSSRPGESLPCPFCRMGLLVIKLVR